MSERLGLTLGLEGADIARAVDMCAAAESLGYTDVWTAEVGGADGFSPLAALAARTKTLRMGTAIVPVFTRPPALLAMQAATLADLSGGRFVLGLGTSSNIIIEKWMGSSFERPLTKLGQTVELVRECLSGKKVQGPGIDGFRLQLPPVEVPIHIAALGPRACELAGRAADGVIFFMKTASGVSDALEHVAKGAADEGRDPAGLDRVIRIPIAMDEDEAVFRFIARRLTVNYAIVDVYKRSLSAQGFETECKAITDAWAAGDREGATAQVTDAMLDELFIFGDEATCRARIAEFRAAGITTPVLLPISVAGDPADRAERIETMIRTLAPG